MQPQTIANDVDYKAMYNVERQSKRIFKSQFGKNLKLEISPTKYYMSRKHCITRTNFKLIQGKYTTLVNRIKYTAPIEVQPYIDSVDTGVQ